MNNTTSTDTDNGNVHSADGVEEREPPQTHSEMKTRFQEVLTEHPNPADDIHADLLIDISATTIWAPNHVDQPAGINTDDFEPADEWHMDTGYHGEELFGSDEIRDLYVFVRDGVWTTVDQDMFKRISICVSQTVPQLLKRVEIDMTNTEGDTAPIRINLELGDMYLSACDADKAELNCM